MSLWEELKDLLFPLRCPGCGEKLPRKRAPLCDGCRQRYRADSFSRCRACGKPHRRCSCRPTYPVREALCYLTVFPYRKDRPGGKLILQLKDREDRAVAAFLARDLAEVAQNGCILQSNALVCHVPRSRAAVLRTGSDQAKLLAQETAKILLLPHADLLIHTGTAAQQKDLGAKGRYAHARSAFALRDRSVSLKGRQVLLIDDVLTTGATLGSCAQLLHELGAKEIVCLCAGRTPRA